MNPEYTFKMAQETVEGLVLPVFRGAEVPQESFTAIWGVVHWMKDMYDQLGGAG